MKLAEYFRHDDQDLARLMKQAGVDYGVLRCPEKGDGSMVYDYLTLARLKKTFSQLGIDIQVIEPLPNDLHEPIKQGLPARDAAIEKLHKLVRTMGRLEIPILCYNFMAAFGWTRTSTVVAGRGGALVSEYDHRVMAGAPNLLDHEITEEQIWANYAYFLKAVLPVAEEAGVTLALHPDDPPLSPIQGVARVFRNPEAFERALALSDSPSHKLTFCQGNFRLMGCDIPAAIERFKHAIAFVHFRDTRGTPEHFVECFHDDGPTDMAAAMRAYQKIGFAGPLRSDHVPTLHGESNRRPGYETLGRLFAVGYIKGLSESSL